MLKIRIICLGKFKEKAFKELEKEYLKRLVPYAKVKIIELAEVSYSEKMDLEAVKLKEAGMIKKQLPKEGVVIMLEEKGQLRNSGDFSAFMERIGGLGQEIVFIVGSGIGLHNSLKEVVNYTMSLSLLTFTHNFARVLLEEQIYRSSTIIAGKNYHK